MKVQDGTAAGAASEPNVTSMPSAPHFEACTPVMECISYDAMIGSVTRTNDDK
jgi:hypothetical protein